MRSRRLIFLAMVLTLVAARTLPALESTLPAELTKDDIRENLRVAKLYFNGGRFAQARDLYQMLLAHNDFRPVAKLVRPPRPKDNAEEEVKKNYRERLNEYEKDFPENERMRLQRQSQIEDALIYLARSNLELAGNDKKKTEEAIGDLLKLAKNEYNFDNPQHKSAAWFYAGLAYFNMGDYATAVKTFGETGATGDTNLDADVSWYRGLAMRELAKDAPVDTPITAEKEKARSKKELLLGAVDAFSKISNNFPQSSHYLSAQLEIIKLHMDMAKLDGVDAFDKYAEADAMAEIFISKVPRNDPNYAYALAIRGRGALLSGNISAAADFYEQALAADNIDKAVQAEASLGLGKAYTSLAKSTGAERRLENYKKARRRLRESLKTLQGEERYEALYYYALSLNQLGEYEEAYKQLEPIINKPEYRVRANHMAGIAKRALGDYPEAIRHFEIVLRSSEKEKGLGLYLEALKSLAYLESTRKNFNAALIYYRRTSRMARKLRDFATVA
ncbi:MAG: tetratricopeptide repeat protein, partial [Planctomycetes bacterium]|nr:tetratricopeptide repeat protein [Planctomycetota bacterium]